MKLPAEVNGRYPEHEKMLKVKDRAEAVGDFLTGYVRGGLALCEKHEHVEGCYDDSGHLWCGLRNGAWAPVAQRTEEILADWFEVDLAEINAEKDAMLAQLRADGRRDLAEGPFPEMTEPVKFPDTPIDGRQRHDHVRQRDGHGGYDGEGVPIHHFHKPGEEHLIEVTAEFDYGHISPNANSTKKEESDDR